MSSPRPNLGVALVTGLVAGFCATWIKARIQTNLSKAQQVADPSPPEESEPPATEKVANAIAKKTVGKSLTKDQKELASPALDYAFGTLAGAAYGVLAEYVPEITTAGGLGYGASLWLFADELGVPAAGFAKWPQEYPLETHEQSLAGHLAYGATLEFLRSVVRKVL